MAKLADSRPTDDVILSGGCVVKVYKSLTVADQRDLEATYGALSQIPKEKMQEAALDFSLKLIKTWDMVNEDDTACLPTAEILARLPQTDLTLILDVVKKVSGETTQS